MIFSQSSSTGFPANSNTRLAIALESAGLNYGDCSAMRSPRPLASRYCLREMTSLTRTFPLLLIECCTIFGDVGISRRQSIARAEQSEIVPIDKNRAPPSRAPLARPLWSGYTSVRMSCACTPKVEFISTSGQDSFVIRCFSSHRGCNNHQPPSRDYEWSQPNIPPPHPQAKGRSASSRQQDPSDSQIDHAHEAETGRSLVRRI